MRKPIHEKERLARLRALNVLDPSSMPSLGSIVKLAAQASRCPAAYISFIESEKQIFHSVYGCECKEIPRSESICADTILSNDALIISDVTEEKRYASSPLIGPPFSFKFYAGFPLITRDHLAIGTLCVLDSKPRTLHEIEVAFLSNLALHVVSQLELQNKLAAVQRTISSLEDSEQRFRKIADASPVLLWISDEAGNRTLSNKAWCDFTGLSQEESLADCWRKTVHPSDREVYEAKWRERAQARTRFQHEFRLRHMSGTYRWVMEQAIPLFGSNGHLEAYVSSCVDLSLRSSDELQYQHNEARFRAISEAAPLGIVVTDSSGNCIYSNHRFQHISGLTAEQSLGSGWLGAIHAEDRDQIQSAWFEATQTTKSFDTSFRYQHTDGTVTWVSLKAAAINATDTVSGWVSTLEDITEKRQAESDLLAAKQAAETAMHTKSQFLANMSHEIRTPLTAIIGFAEALRDEGTYNQTQLHCLDVIRNNGQHLLTIINQILDLSKIDAGALTIEHGSCNIVQTIEEIRFMFAPTIADKGLSFSVESESSLPHVITTDALRFKQVLINLVGNAIKFTAAGGITLRVRWSDTEHQLHCEVTDSGIGMSPEQIDGLFKPFCQANESITRQYGGTGLGLSISERLVRALGGAMEVRSEPGKGSTFSFYITSQSPSQHSSPLAGMMPTGRKIRGELIPPPQLSGRVLFADDALDNRRLVEMFLRKAGVEVVMVEDGKQAIDSALSSHFDLILMDVQMPVMDGLTATRNIRGAGISTPIVALSAGAMTSDVEKAIEAGCSMHLSKPFSKDSFYQMLSKYLEGIKSPGASERAAPLHSSLEGGDPEMLPLLLEFIAGLQGRLSELQDAVASANAERCASVAHKLKGSSGMYGFPELSVLAGKLEGAAKTGTHAECGPLVSTISSVIKRIKAGAPAAPSISA